MNRVQIGSFLILAETKSFTKTAMALHTSQPTITRQIRNLEEELGTSLFYRNRRKMQITESGKAYYKLFHKWKGELTAIQKKYPPDTTK